MAFGYNRIKFVKRLVARGKRWFLSRCVGQDERVRGIMCLLILFVDAVCALIPFCESSH